MTTNNPARSAAAQRSGAVRSGVRAIASEIPVTPSEPPEDQPDVLRIDQLPPDVGWLLVYVGVLGVVLPGIPGFPFLIAGGAVLLPGGPKLLTRWAGRNPPRFVHASMKQISRLVDDLERRYPRLPRAPS
ncbi:MAG: hypothetical protein WAK01_07110 [Methylocystis sp.]